VPVALPRHEGTILAWKKWDSDWGILGSDSWNVKTMVPDTKGIHNSS